MKEATGETSMTMITIVAIGAIAAILTFLMPYIKDWVKNEFDDVSGVEVCPNGPGTC